jgi:small subunit ribosomal protein S4e
MAHLKRLTAPESWQIKKKEYKFITRPNPGAHALADSIPLNIIVKNLFGYASTTHESKKIIGAGKILVDKVPRKDHRYNLGLMDILEIPETKHSYILLMDKHGKFQLHQTKHNDVKYCKVIGKTILKGKKTQLNLSSARNLLVAKDEYKLGDTILLGLKDNKAKGHLKLEKDAIVYVTAGKYKGNIAKVVEIHKSNLSDDKITIKIGAHKFETLKDYAFVVDKNFALEDEHKQSDETN